MCKNICQNVHSRQTEAGPQILSCTAEEKSQYGSLRVPGLKAPGAGHSHHISPGLSHRGPGAFFTLCQSLLRRWQRVAIERKTQAFSFFSFLFSYAQNCFPLFFSFKREGGDRFWSHDYNSPEIKQRAQRKEGRGGMKEGEGGRIRQRDALMVRIPLSQSTFTDSGGKKWWFLDGGPVRTWRGYRGSLLSRTALVFVSVWHILSSLVSPFCVFYQHGLVLNARSVALMQL